VREQSFTTVAKPVHCSFRIILYYIQTNIIYHCTIGVFLSYQTNSSRTITALGVCTYIYITSVGQAPSKSPKIVIPLWVSCSPFDSNFAKRKHTRTRNERYRLNDWSEPTVYTYHTQTNVNIFAFVPVL